MLQPKCEKNTNQLSSALVKDLLVKYFYLLTLMGLVIMQ